MPPKAVPIPDRLAARIDRSGGSDACWPWLGTITAAGYGRMSIPPQRQVYAHRVAYEFERGPIPDGYEVDHLCFNPACCNPRHLEAVTPEENKRRIRQRGYSTQTHCAQGHELTVETLTANGWCRVCRRAAQNRWQREKRKAAKEAVAPQAWCPDCGEGFGSPRAIGTHRHRVHGFRLVTPEYGDMLTKGGH